MMTKRFVLCNKGRCYTAGLSFNFLFIFVGLALVGKDRILCLDFIIEYIPSSLRDFGP
jgi:hypothetical protein